MEQIVDTPVSSASLDGLRPDLGSTAFGQAEHHGFLPEQGSTAFLGQDFSGGPARGLQILSRDRVQLVMAVVKTLVEVFKTLSEDGVQQRLAEMVVMMLTLVLSLNGPRSSCGCGRMVLFGWCWPSGMRRCVTSSALQPRGSQGSASPLLLFRRSPLARRHSSPGRARGRPRHRCCGVERKRRTRRMWVGMRGLASPHPILGAISGAPGFWQSCVVSSVA